MPEGTNPIADEVSLLPTWIKVCGITNLHDARLAEALGADALGLVLQPDDARSIRLDLAAEIAASVTVETVAVLREADPDQARRIALTVEPHRLQLEVAPAEPLPVPWYLSLPCRGREVIPALKDIGDRFHLALHKDLLPGGARFRRDPRMLREAGRMGRAVLGGPFSRQQLPELLRAARPWGLDIGACAEQEPGLLDPQALAALMKELGRAR